jgi:large subunit ribosomal protein L34
VLALTGCPQSPVRSLPRSGRIMFSTAMPRTVPWSMLSASLRSSRILSQPMASASSSRTLSLISSTPSTSTFSRLPNLRTSLLSSTTPSSLSSTSPLLQQLRFKAYGAEYQPSQRKRKRKHGFLARLRGGKLGLSMLTRRRKIGRRFLSH